MTFVMSLFSSSFAVADGDANGTSELAHSTFACRSSVIIIETKKGCCSNLETVGSIESFYLVYHEKYGYILIPKICESGGEYIGIEPNFIPPPACILFGHDIWNRTVITNRFTHNWDSHCHTYSTVTYQFCNRNNCSWQRTTSEWHGAIAPHLNLGRQQTFEVRLFTRCPSMHCMEQGNVIVEVCEFRDCHARGPIISESLTFTQHSWVGNQCRLCNVIR